MWGAPLEILLFLFGALRLKLFLKLRFKIIFKIIAMDLIQKHNREYAFFKEITGEAMRVHAKFKPGLLESAYEAALKYLLEQKGWKIERQVFLPIYWDNVKLDQNYRWI